MLDGQIIICFCGVCPRLEGFCRAKSVICGQGERHRNNILYKLKYGRGANCERSHYKKTAGRKCFATAENLQVQSDHQTVTLHLAWRLRSADRYLPYRKGWIRCHAFVCSLSLFFFHFMSSVLLHWKTWHLSSLIPFSLLFPLPPTLPMLILLPLCSILSFFPPQQPFLIAFSLHVPPCFHLRSQTCSFLLLSPSFSLCLWSVTLNLTPSICFSSFVWSALLSIKITSGFDLLVGRDPFEVVLWVQVS